MEIADQGETKIVRTIVDGQEIFFTIKHVIDVIQRHHQKGQFYEPVEIAEMTSHFSEGATILDIGTNVGNHALWFAKFKAARRVYVFEPNPEIIEVLRSNIALNKIDDVVVTDHLGIGLSDVTADGYEIRVNPKNLGGGRMFSHGGDLTVRPGDDLIPADEQIDFIKIDVERMEMQVLAGLAKTIARCRPPIFVEVDREHIDAFELWCRDNRYRVVQTFQHTKRNINHMCLPD